MPTFEACRTRGPGMVTPSSASARQQQPGISTGGKSLDTETHRFMESRFHHDFSRVRVHADVATNEAARDLRARLPLAPTVQLQAAPKEDPKAAALHTEFDTLRKNTAAREKMNASVAHAIARAYVSRSKPAKPATPAALHATQYLDERVPKIDDEPSEAEVYAAIVDVFDITGVAGDTTTIRWNPHLDPNEGRRDDALTEVGKTVVDFAADQLIDVAVEAAADWVGVGELRLVVHRVQTGGKPGEMLEIGIKVLELIETLKKPVKRPLYKYERIRLNVIGWMAGEQAAAEAAKKAAQPRIRELAPADALDLGPRHR